VPGKYYQATRHQCVKNSRVKSLINTVEMYLHHTVWDIYRKNIDLFVTENEFMRGWLLKAGYASDRVRVLPNFVDVAAYRPYYDTSSDYLLYFGRLVPEKGVATLIEAVRTLPLKLVIVGDGFQRLPLEQQASASGASNVIFAGAKWGRDLEEIIAGARFVVVPSEWHENSPMVIYQSFAWGKPVIGARVGGITELIEDGVDGWLFESAQVHELREEIQRAFADPAAAAEMGRQARLKAEREFSAEVYYERLLSIYAEARRRRAMS
jgi:glycosyltransferase involved in cell wall biosynthesis